MISAGFKTTILTVVMVVIGLGFVFERRAVRKLDGEVVALKADVERLSEQVASQQQENARLEGSRNTPPLHEPLPELKRLEAEIARLRDRIAQLESANAAVSNQLAAASGANTPFFYSDSVRKKDYAFSGYAAPQSALHSMFWALSQSDPRAYQASVTGETAEAFASAIKDLPEGIMPGGYKNGALYRASGYRVMEETPLSDNETRVKVFLEGRQNLVLKLVFKNINGEWKMARTEF